MDVRIRKQERLPVEGILGPEKIEDGWGGSKDWIGCVGTLAQKVIFQEGSVEQNDGGRRRQLERRQTA